MTSKRSASFPSAPGAAGSGSAKHGRLRRSSAALYGAPACACVFFSVGAVGDVDLVPVLLGDLRAGRIAISLVQRQVLGRALRIRPLNGDAVQGRFQQVPIGRVGPTHDEAQRYPAFVYQQAALGSTFGPIG